MASNLDIGPLQHSTLDIGPLQSSATVGVTKSLADALQTATDGLSFSISISISFNDSNIPYDSIELSDEVSLLLLGDTLQWNWSDLLTYGSATVNYALNDSNVPLDNLLTPVLQPAFLFQDAFSIQDTPLPNLISNYLFSDSLTYSDQFTLINLYVVLESISGDILNIQDGFILQFNAGLYLVLSDNTGGPTDVLFDVISLPIIFIDNIKNYADFISIGHTQGAGIQLGDYFILGENLLPLLGMRFFENDSVGFSDFLSESIQNTTQQDTMNDSYNLNDNIFLQSIGVLSIPLGDSYTLSDSFVESVPEPLNNYLRRYLNDVVM